MFFLAEKLAKLMDDLDLSTYDVERMTGIRQSVVSDLRNGITKSPRQSTVTKLCEGLKVNQEYFYTDDAKLPSELLPDMPEETKRFLMTGSNIPYIIISEKAKKEGIPPEILQQALDLLIANRDIKK